MRKKVFLDIFNVSSWRKKKYSCEEGSKEKIHEFQTGWGKFDMEDMEVIFII